MADVQKSMSADGQQHASDPTFHGVRYQVSDVSRSVTFYTERLGFKLQHQQPPAFASVSLGPLVLLLSGPGASGSRPMPDGRRQQRSQVASGQPREPRRQRQPG